MRHALRNAPTGCLRNRSHDQSPRLVTQLLFVKFLGDTLAARQRFSPDTSWLLHYGLAGLLHYLLIGFNALPSNSKIGFNGHGGHLLYLTGFTPAASQACSNQSRNRVQLRRQISRDGSRRSTQPTTATLEIRPADALLLIRAESFAVSRVAARDPALRSACKFRYRSSDRTVLWPITG